MSGTTLQAEPGTSPPHLGRVRCRVLAGLDRAPIVHLWGWPGTGGAALVDALAVDWARPVQVVRPSSPDADVQPADGQPAGDVFAVVDRFEQLDPEAVRRSVGRGGRWVVSCPRRPLPSPQRSAWEVSGLAIHRILPDALLLERSEVEAWASSVSFESVEWLWRTTGGWWRPGELLMAAGPARVEVADCKPLHDWFRRHFLPRLGDTERSVLADLVACGEAEGALDLDPDLDLDAWRLAEVDRPERLAALERLRHGWALLPDGRPPKLLARLPRELWGPADSTSARLEWARSLLSETGDLPTTQTGSKPSSPPPEPSPSASVEPVSVAGRVRFEIRLLGEPEVARIDDEGRTVLRWRLRRALGTLLFLALSEGHRARKEALVEALWAETEEGAVRRNFHPTLSETRRTLGAGVETLSCRHSVYSLAEEVDWWVDAEAFESAVEAGYEHRRREEPEAAVECWRQAWKLYRGPLLAADESPWTTDPRLRLQELYLGMLRGLGELASTHEEPTLAIDAYRSLLLEEAYEEPVHRALMELYARRGRRDLVRRQYVRLQELLLDDLGIEPSLETQERYHELMR